MEEECCEQIREGEEDEENLQPEQLFARNFRSLDIKIESLPEYSKKKVVYTKQNPAFVVAWLQDHLSALFKEQQTFMTDYVETIQPKNFEVGYKEARKQVEVDLEFLIGDEEQVSLKLVGQLHRSEKGEVGVEW